MILFWMEVNQLYTIHDERRKRDKAARIYETYIQADSTSSIDLDKITRTDIQEDLGIDDKGVVKQRDYAKWSRAFNLAHNKVFTTLKVVYMPRFLISDNFANLKSISDADLITHEVGQLLMSIDLGGIFDSVAGLYYFKEYLSSPFTDGILNEKIRGDELFELLRQIDDFTQTADLIHKRKRAVVIFKRFEALKPDLVELQLSEGRFKKTVANFSELGDGSALGDGSTVDGMFASLFTDVVAVGMKLLTDEHLQNFKATIYFKKFTHSIAKKKAEGSLSNGLESLRKYAEEQLTPTTASDSRGYQYHLQSARSLMQVLQEKTGIHYFKQFAMRNFQEENVCFWVEVNNFEHFDSEYEQYQSTQDESKASRQSCAAGDEGAFISRYQTSKKLTVSASAPDAARSSEDEDGASSSLSSSSTATDLGATAASTSTSGDSRGSDASKESSKEGSESRARLTTIREGDVAKGDDADPDASCIEVPYEEVSPTGSIRSVNSISSMREESGALWARRERAVRIVNKYVLDGAPLQVNLSAQMRKNLTAKMGSTDIHGIEPHMFREAQDEIFKLVRENCLRNSLYISRCVC
jgi:hypothetical protein